MTQKYFFKQTELDSICYDRPLVTSEIHDSNDYYGQASVLKRYVGLDEEDSLKVVLEHGINLDDQMWAYDRDSQMPMILSPSKWRAEVHHQLSGKPSLPIGFGFLYAMELVEKLHPWSGQRQGTLAFPCHSTHTITAKFSHEDYAQRLKTLAIDQQPVSVCLYWKNYLLGDHLPYLDQGLEVVSAGHMYDKDFLLRLADLARRFRFAVSNEIGTHLFMMANSGCQFYYLDSQPIQWEIPQNELQNSAQENQLFRRRYQESRTLFAGPAGIDKDAQTAFAENLIGSDCVKTPQELRAILKQAEALYKKQKFQQWIQRRISKIQRIKESITKRLPWRKTASK